MKKDQTQQAAGHRRRLARCGQTALAVVLGIAAGMAGAQPRGGGSSKAGGWSGGGNSSWGNGSGNNGNWQGEPRRDADSRGAGGPRGPRGPREGRASMADSRSQRVDQLLRDNPGRFERDLAGAPVLRGEVTVLLPVAAPLPDTLSANGFSLLREQGVLGRRLVVLRIPAGMALPDAVDLAQKLMPGTDIDFNHVHLDGGIAGPGSTVSDTLPEGGSPGKGAAVLRVGLVDEALLPAPELQSTRIDVHACGGVRVVPGHCTAVAAVIVRTAQRLGRPAHLYAADLACGRGGVDAIADALEWMATQRVPVVNISVVGPRNLVLEAVVGNDGPSASALYPAAYPGVVAVTAVDQRSRVLVEAGRGDHVAFAAPGIVEVDVGGSGRLQRWRGTSFAAPWWRPRWPHG